MRMSLLRLALVGAVAAAGAALSATPAAADGCQPVVTWTEHRIYKGPPGEDIWIMVPAVIMGDCDPGTG